MGRMGCGVLVLFGWFLWYEEFGFDKRIKIIVELRDFIDCFLNKII